MGGAVRGGNEEMFDLCLSLGANNFNEALYGASWAGKINLFKRCMELGADNFQEVVNTSLFAPKASDYQNAKEIAKICIENGANLDNIMFGDVPFPEKEQRDAIIYELRMIRSHTTA